jgi:hypothetical protein
LQDRRYQGQGLFGPDGLSASDQDLFLEVFWALFREGVITLGLNDSNREFPHFRISEFGRRIASHQHAYFFHDVSSYESSVRSEIPAIDDVTVLYLKEAMQSFRTGCVLASTVMLGVATEHTFLLLVETIENNATNAQTFANVGQQRTTLQKVNKFRNLVDQELRNLPPEIKSILILISQAFCRSFGISGIRRAIRPAGSWIVSRSMFCSNSLFRTAKRCISSSRTIPEMHRAIGGRACNPRYSRNSLLIY